MSDDRITLGELVFKLVQENKTKDPEFQALLKYFGREKLLFEYDKEKKKRLGSCDLSKSSEQEKNA